MIGRNAYLTGKATKKVQQNSKSEEGVICRNISLFSHLSLTLNQKCLRVKISKSIKTSFVPQNLYRLYRLYVSVNFYSPK